MGTRGPMPKRGSELKGHVSRARRDGDDVTTVAVSQSPVFKAKPPAASGDWSASAKLLWKNLKISAPASLYEPSDWAVAKLLMGQITAYQARTPRNSQLLAAIASVFDELLLTEGSRRRLRTELELRETPVKPPHGSQDWDPDAKALWKAAKSGGQVKYYEPSDWAVLHFLCTELTMFGTSKSSGHMLTTLNSLRANLMLTEGTRRRLDLELGAASNQQVGQTAGQLEAERLFAYFSNLVTDE